MNLVDEAQELMLYQFKNSSKLIGLVRSLVEPLETVANTVQALRDDAVKEINSSPRYRLQILANLLNILHTGMSDNDLRTWIKVQIELNHGHATAEKVLAIFNILLGHHISLTEYFPNEVFLVFFGAFSIPSKVVFDVARKASPLGTNLRFIRADVKPLHFDTNKFSESHFADFF